MQLALILVAALILSCHADAQQRQRGLHQPHSQSNQQQTATDTRGTENNPVIVKELPSKRTAEETKEAENKAQLDRELAEYTGDLASYTKGLFVATLALAALTGALAVAAFLQILAGRAAVNAAIYSATAAGALALETKRQADAAEQHLTTLERPYLYISGANVSEIPRGRDILYGPEGDPIRTDMSLHIEIRNYGRTPGIFRDIILVPVNTPQPAYPEYDAKPRIRRVANIPIATLDHISVDVNWEAFPRKDNLFIYGRIRYENTVGNRFVVGFGVRKYSISREMHGYGGSAYNYQRLDESADDASTLQEGEEQI